MKKHAALFALAACVILATAVPVFYAARSTAGFWQGVPPSAENYYYSRLREIKDGYPFIGNPYFFEHRNEVSPAFFVADWIAAVPLLLGATLIPTIVLNLFVWALVNVLLYYLFLRVLGCPKRWAAGGAFVVFLTTYADILRPVSLQVVAPAFTLLGIAAVRWLEQPRDKKRLAGLALALTYSVYIYTYLTQIALAFLGLVFLLFIWKKQWKEAQALGLVVGGVGILSLPFAWYAYHQVTHPAYWETMVRVGLVNTHLPTSNAFVNLFWVASMLALWRLFIARTDRRPFLFFVLTGVALVGVSFSNIVTGKELELAQHIMRFVALWFAFAAASGAFFLFASKPWRNASVTRRIALAGFLCLNLAGLAVFANRYGIAGLSYVLRPVEENTTLRNDQSVAPALAWLEKNEPRSTVVWAPPDSPINDNVTILTKHYVLFSMGGILHIVTDKEVEERYLLSKAFAPVTVQDIERDYRIYGGSGNAVHASNTHNRGVTLCRLLRLNWFGTTCGELTDPVSFKGEAYFAALRDRLNNDIRPNLARELASFHVAYLVSDDKLYPNLAQEIKDKLPNAKLVYSDKRFSVFKLPASSPQ